MNRKIIAALRHFDSYAHGVRVASYYFLEKHLPQVSADAKVCVSMFLDKPELSLDYRDVEAFTNDTSEMIDVLDIVPTTTENDVRKCHRFTDETCTITLSMWK